MRDRNNTKIRDLDFDDLLDLLALTSAPPAPCTESTGSDDDRFPPLELGGEG